MTLANRLRLTRLRRLPLLSRSHGLPGLQGLVLIMLGLALAGPLAAQVSVLLPTSGELRASLALPGDVQRGQGRAELFYPMVAAQHASYLVRELGLIRNGGRGNSNPAMAQVLQGYSADDQQAVAAYLSQLAPPVAR